MDIKLNLENVHSVVYRMENNQLLELELENGDLVGIKPYSKLEKVIESKDKEYGNSNEYFNTLVSKHPTRNLDNRNTLKNEYRNKINEAISDVNENKIDTSSLEKPKLDLDSISCDKKEQVLSDFNEIVEKADKKASEIYGGATQTIAKIGTLDRPYYNNKLTTEQLEEVESKYEPIRKDGRK